MGRLEILFMRNMRIIRLQVSNSVSISVSVVVANIHTTTTTTTTTAMKKTDEFESRFNAPMLIR